MIDFVGLKVPRSKMPGESIPGPVAGKRWKLYLCHANGTDHRKTESAVQRYPH